MGYISMFVKRGHFNAKSGFCTNLKLPEIHQSIWQWTSTSKLDIKQANMGKRQGLLSYVNLHWGWCA